MTTPAWHVVQGGITQTTQLAPSGRGLQDVYEIPFVIDSGPAQGHQGTVTVPVDNAGSQAVAMAINAQAAAVHGIGGLALDSNGNLTA